MGRDDRDTPLWVADVFLRDFARRYREIFGANPSDIWEPAAGRGALVVPIISHFPEARVMATTIEEGVDFLNTTRDLKSPWLIITNPPFSRASEFIEKSLSQSGEGAVALLLRLSILGSVKRLPLFRQYGPPSFLYVITPRPSFDGVRTDHEEYGWFVWLCGRQMSGIVPGMYGAQYQGHGTVIVWLEGNPYHERELRRSIEI